MPLMIVEQLKKWGHSIDVLEPHTMITCLSDLSEQNYDAYVLKRVSDGPGLSILEAAESIGIPTINNSRAIRLVRDKAVATAYAQANAIPTPRTYFAAHSNLLMQIPESDYPLVIKPSNATSWRGIYKVKSPAELMAPKEGVPEKGFLLAQRYLENSGFDIKLYVIGRQVFSVAKKSPLHPDVGVDKQIIPITLALRNLALQVGEIFGLEIYGLDVVDTPQGLVVVDINDFPSFGCVSRATERISEYIIRIAKRVEQQRRVNMPPTRVSTTKIL